jgi:hypothetical protein
LEELLNGPSALDFLFVGANVPRGGTDPVSGATFFGANPGDAALATPYFSNIYKHGDWFDGIGGNWAGLSGAFPGSEALYESLVVRNLPATSVPTPALLPGLIGMGLGAVRKRRENQAQEALEGTIRVGALTDHQG